MKSYFVINNQISYNTIVYTGIAEVLKKVFLQTDGDNPFSYIGIGLGKSPSMKYDTDLEFEISRQEASFHYIVQSNSFYLQTTFPAGSIEGNISEVAVFNKPAFGIMLARAILNPSRFKAKSKSFTILWRYNFEWYQTSNKWNQ